MALDDRPLTKQVFNPQTGKFSTVEISEEAIQSQSPTNALTSDILEKLEGYSKEELIALIKRVSGAMWGYALLDDEQKAEAARLKLYNLGMTATEVHKVVPALDKWFDRTVGKAAQSIQLDANMNVVTVNATIRFADQPIVIEGNTTYSNDEQLTDN